MRVAPEKEFPVGVEFENPKVDGSKRPTLEVPTFAVIVREGAKTTFPEGKRHPPL